MKNNFFCFSKTNCASTMGVRKGTVAPPPLDFGSRYISYNFFVNTCQLWLLHLPATIKRSYSNAFVALKPLFWGGRARKIVDFNFVLHHVFHMHDALIYIFLKFYIIIIYTYVFNFCLLPPWKNYARTPMTPTDRLPFYKKVWNRPKDDIWRYCRHRMWL